MSYYHFKPPDLQVHIFLRYDYQNKTKTILLHELNIFKDKNNIVKITKAKELKLADTSNKFEKEILEKVENLFREYFSGGLIDLFTEIQKLNVNLDLKSKYKSEFALKILRFLINVKPGETTSYYEIGTKIGSKAYRAVGNVCRSNPIPLIVPCHRVLKKNGGIGGFMGKNSDKEWETNLKKKLLILERAKF
ncbi:MAG: methylated-DNA--[protein]-cysteine S-methyltransferase [Promethearchaeota archaeon]